MGKRGRPPRNTTVQLLQLRCVRRGGRDRAGFRAVVLPTTAMAAGMAPTDEGGDSDVACHEERRMTSGIVG